jgi:glycosyltransferase involved in cell wall biosynthesis
VVCVATLNAIKGHSLLIRSLARLREMNWRLSCAGSTTRDTPTAAAIRRLICETGLEDRVTLLGELPATELQRLLDTADVFALATHFETFGMAVAEAVARGLPVISTRTGSIPGIVGDEAGLLVRPNDEEALTAALRCVIGDPTVRARLHAGALRARHRLEPWSSAVAKFAALLAEIGD